MPHRIDTSASSPAGAPPPASVALWLRWLPLVSGLATALLGLAAVEAYVFGSGPDVSSPLLLPQTVPLVAVMFVLAGASLLSLLARLHRHQAIAAGLVILIATLVLLEYLVWWDLGLDRLLFADDLQRIPSAFPGRPAPITTASFLLIGLSLLLAVNERHLQHRRAHVASLIAAGGLPLFAIVGHVAGLPELYQLAPGIGLSLADAVLLVLLAIGVVAATHQSTLSELIAGRDPGTILLRRLLPVAVMVPVFFAAGSLLALRLGFYQKHVALALFIATFVGPLADGGVSGGVRGAPRGWRAAGRRAGGDGAGAGRAVARGRAGGGRGAPTERAADARAARDPQSRPGARAKPGRPDPVLERRCPSPLRLGAA